MSALTRILLASIVTVLLGGCAAAIVTGVATGGALVHDRRSTGTIIDDQEILLEAMRQRNADEQIVQRSNISLTVYNLQILMTGQAERNDIVERLRNELGSIGRVRGVYNEVVIGAESTWADATGDAYLTSKVKLALFNINMDGFDPTRVKVVSAQGTVYLMGLLTATEADAVTEEVRYVSGVKRVVKLFEYVDA